MNFSIKEFFSKGDQILQIWSHLLKKSLIENFIFCVVIRIIITIFNVNIKKGKYVNIFTIFLLISVPGTY